MGYGEIVSINLIRDKDTGKSKGFAFLCYEDQRSTVPAGDNLNGSKVCGRQLRGDHVEEYKVPKEDEKNEHNDELTNRIHEHGVAPQVMHMYNKKVKEEKKIKKSKKSKKRRKSSSSSDSETSSTDEDEERKRHKKSSKKRRRRSSSREERKSKKNKKDEKSSKRSKHGGSSSKRK